MTFRALSTLVPKLNESRAARNLMDVYALIHLDGTDTYLSHGIKPKSQKMGEIKTGTRVKAVFKDSRRGTIGDFYFVPVD